MKKFIFVAVLAAMSAMAYAAFYANMVEEDSYLSAMDSFDKKDFAAARSGFEEFLAKFPDSKYRASAMLRMAELKETTAEKEIAYNEVMKDFPNSESEAEAVFSLGRMYYAAGDYKKSRDFLNIILNKYPKMVWVEESYYYLMLCCLAEKNYALLDKAYAEYNGDKGFFKQKKRVQLAYADSLMERAKFSDAAVIYKELMDKADSSDRVIYMPAVYKKAAQAFEKSGDAKTAEIISTDLRLKFPDSPEATGKDTAPQPEPTQPQPAATKAVSAAATGAKGFYTVQIGAYANKKFCDLTARHYEEKKYTVFVKKEGKFYRLMVGKLATKAQAEEFAKDLAKKEKLKSWLVKEAWE